MHYSSSELQSAVTLQKQLLTFNLPSKNGTEKLPLLKNSYVSNIKRLSKISKILHFLKNYITPGKHLH